MWGWRLAWSSTTSGPTSKLLCSCSCSRPLPRPADVCPAPESGGGRVHGQAALSSLPRQGPWGAWTFLHRTFLDVPTTPTPERWALGITASSGRTAVVTQRQGGTHSGGAPCQLPGLPTPHRTQRTWRAGTGAPLFPTKKPTAHRNTRISFFIQAPSVQQTPPRIRVRASLHPWLHPAHQCPTRPHPSPPPHNWPSSSRVPLGSQPRPLGLCFSF